MNAPFIKPNPTRSAGSTAVLEFMIRTHPLTARRDELLYVFSEVDTRTTDTSPLVKRFDAALSNMVKTGMLLCCGAGADREWSLGPLVLQDDTKKAKAKKAPPTPDATPDPEAAPVWVGTRAPAPGYDAMRNSLYQPRPWNVPRPASASPAERSAMNHEEIQEHQAHILHLSSKLLTAAEGASHNLLLEALITAFVAVAEQHSCCTQMAAYAAALATERLQTTIDAAATRPQGAPVH